MAASGKYWGLYTKDDGHWAYEFGDTERGTVVFEQDCWAQGCTDEGKKRKKKDTLIKVWDHIPSDAEIMAFRATLT